MTEPRLLLAVAGAHLSGQPLNPELTDRGGRLVATTTTAPAYRMVRLDTTPPKPGLIRVDGEGGRFEVEVWELDADQHAAFAATVAPPLAIAPLELADGRWVPGFVCDPATAVVAEDLSGFSGWRAWLAAGSG